MSKKEYDKWWDEKKFSRRDTIPMAVSIAVPYFGIAIGAIYVGGCYIKGWLKKRK